MCNFDQIPEALNGTIREPRSAASGRIYVDSFKTLRQVALEHSQLESVILQRTAELQSLSQRLLKVQDEERRKFLATCTTALAKRWRH